MRGGSTGPLPLTSLTSRPGTSASAVRVEAFRPLVPPACIGVEVPPARPQRASLGGSPVDRSLGGRRPVP
jgi:hypothetical protein